MNCLSSLNTGDLILKLRDFARERDWEQFHTPKNLVMALSVECSELVEHFQWLTPEEAQDLKSENPETTERREKVSEEVCDILFYLLRFSDIMNIDLQEAAKKKYEKNAKKYPAEKVRGNSKKYNEYE
ncbi:MAG: nucleotide pyrophosphohydrolase [Deltaproteobacteria bacterium]|nr:MAG: nucleotide pyrophosphohydrolase [Deltaproteobacteria bacterium]TNF28325.1 MAG: nucleotide pyrophosphohydrolase [Deltaproteobacteria bacterium]